MQNAKKIREVLEMSLGFLMISGSSVDVLSGCVEISGQYVTSVVGCWLNWMKICVKGGVS